MNYGLMFSMIVCLSLVVVCNNIFSKRNLKRERDIVITNKSSFYALILFVEIMIIVLTKKFDIFMFFVGILFTLIGIISLFIEPIIIRFNDEFIELEYFNVEKFKFKYEDVISVWRGGRRKSRLYVYVRVVSKTGDDTSFKFEFSYYTKNRKKIIKKLEEKGIIVRK